MSLKKISVILMIATLYACAAALVPSTDDPQEKLLWSYQLMDVGRALPAERLQLEALAIYTSEGNYLGEGNAYKALCLLYRSSAYRAAEKFYRKQGTYDPTYTKSIEFCEKSAEAYRRGEDLWGVSSALVGVADGYQSMGENEKACSTYKESLATYKDPKAIFTGVVHGWNPKYATQEEMLVALISQYCGETVQ